MGATEGGIVDATIQTPTISKNCVHFSIFDQKSKSLKPPYLQLPCIKIAQSHFFYLFGGPRQVPKQGLYLLKGLQRVVFRLWHQQYRPLYVFSTVDVCLQFSDLCWEYMGQSKELAMSTLRHLIIVMGNSRVPHPGINHYDY